MTPDQPPAPIVQTIQLPPGTTAITVTTYPAGATSRDGTRYMSADCPPPPVDRQSAGKGGFGGYTWFCTVVRTHIKHKISRGGK